MQEPCSTLTGVGHFGQDILILLQIELQEADDRMDEENFIAVPRRNTEVIEVPVPMGTERTDGGTLSSADAVSQDSYMDQMVRAT